MKDLEYRHYRLALRSGGVSPIEEDGKKTDHFSKPVTETRLPKLYVVIANGRVAYIGCTTRSIRDRLEYGFKATGRGGYHGYKWKKLSEVDLFVWCFPQLGVGKVEFLEAELVYQIRTKTGRWPEYQMEIHFSNPHEGEEALRETVDRIFEQLRGEMSLPVNQSH